MNTNTNLNLENGGKQIMNTINTLNIERKGENEIMENTSTLNMKENGGNKMLFMSKIYYTNIFKILKHEKIEDDAAPKSFNLAFRRYIKEEVYGDSLYLLPTTLTRYLSSDKRSVGYVTDGYGKYVFFDSGYNNSSDWDKKIRIQVVPDYLSIPKDGGFTVDLKEAGAKIKELFGIKEVC